MPGLVPVHTSVPVSTSAVEVVASTPTRKGLLVYNHSSQILYIKYGTGVAISPASFTIAIPANWYGRLPWGNVYTGAVWGMWAGADASGSAQVTQLVG